MSTRKRQRRTHQVLKKTRQVRGSASSLMIPIIVGVIVMAVGAFAIWTLERQQPAKAAVPGDISAPIPTAGPQQTSAIPYPDVPRISVADSMAMFEKGEVMLIDVRGRAEYDTSHAAGAISIPSTEIDSRLSELPRDKEIVLYCT